MLNTTNSANILSAALAAAVATNGTINFSYPAGYSKGNYLLSDHQHILLVGHNKYVSPRDFAVTFGANSAGVTLTNLGASTWPAGAMATLQLNLSGIPSPSYSGAAGGALNPANPGLITASSVILDLGSPNAGAANNISTSQAVAGAGNLTITGTLAANGVAAMDVPRTLQFVSSNSGDTTQTVTISGVDEYGQKVTETVTLNGTTIVVSKKAVMSVSKLAVSAALAGNIVVGSSNTIGLPIAIYKAAQVVVQAQDGAVATAGTLTGADASTPSATTGDVRGTYAPNSTPNGTLGFALYCVVPDRSNIGVTNYGV